MIRCALFDATGTELRPCVNAGHSWNPTLRGHVCADHIRLEQRREIRVIPGEPPQAVRIATPTSRTGTAVVVRLWIDDQPVEILNGRLTLNAQHPERWRLKLNLPTREFPPHRGCIVVRVTLQDNAGLRGDGWFHGFEPQRDRGPSERLGFGALVRGVGVLEDLVPSEAGTKARGLRSPVKPFS